MRLLTLLLIVTLTLQAQAKKYNPSTFSTNAINNIAPNELVELENGVYNIWHSKRNALQNIPNGVTIKAINRHGVIFNESGANTRVIYFQNKSNITIENIHFKNIALWYKNCTNVEVNWNKFDTFENKTYDIRNAIIDAQNCNGVKIFRNDILWKDNTVNNTTYTGSFNKFLGNAVGIQSKNGTGGKHEISYNTIRGFLRTGIRYWSIYSNSGNFGLIKKNNCERYAAAPDSTSTLKYEDHGMYVLFGSYLRIWDNDVEGWSSGSSGGSLKIKWFDVAEITNNSFRTSGILFRNKLDNIYVVGNDFFDASSTASQFYHTSSSETIKNLHYVNNDLHGGILNMSQQAIVTSGNLNGTVQKISGTVTAKISGNENGTLNIPSGTTEGTAANNPNCTVNAY